MRIPPRLLDEVIAHARAEAPKECCGLIATRDGTAVGVHRVRNVASNPKSAYHMDPMEQYRVMQGVEDAGCEIGAIYHSHPRTDPVPSLTDVNLATAWPEQLFVIVGPGTPEPDVRAFRIVDRAVTEVGLEVEDVAPLDA